MTDKEFLKELEVQTQMFLASLVLPKDKIPKELKDYTFEIPEEDKPEIFSTLYDIDSRSFNDVQIVPRVLFEPLSRKDIDVKTSLYTIEGFKRKIYPFLGASMSFMWERFGIALNKAGGLHVLPRVQRSYSERLSAAKAIKQETKISAAAIGVNDSLEFIEALLKYVDFISIDIAHGASAKAALMLRRLAELGVDSGVIVGNIGFFEGALYLLLAAQMLGYENIALKVGVGPGAACTTRIMTGVGIGQMSALQNIKNFLELYDPGLEVKIISDGGVETPGDVAKALTISDAVMMGKFFASPEFDTEVVEKDGEKYLKYYGMASKEAKNGDSEEYVEGDVVYIKQRWNSVEEAVKTLKQGLQSAFSYVGAKNLREFHLMAYTVENTLGTVIESRTRGDL